jgi:hypothetical protein
LIILKVQDRAKKNFSDKLTPFNLWAIAREEVRNQMHIGGMSVGGQTSAGKFFLARVRERFAVLKLEHGV